MKRHLLAVTALPLFLSCQSCSLFGCSDIDVDLTLDRTGMPQNGVGIPIEFVLAPRDSEVEQQLRSGVRDWWGSEVQTRMSTDRVLSTGTSADQDTIRASFPAELVGDPPNGQIFVIANLPVSNDAAWAKADITESCTYKFELTSKGVSHTPAR